MKVLLTIPFRDFVADAGPGERGEVVRVEHFKDGRTGVAVRLLKSTKAGLNIKCIRLELKKQRKVQFPNIA